MQLEQVEFWTRWDCDFILGIFTSVCVPKEKAASMPHRKQEVCFYQSPISPW